MILDSNVLIYFVQPPYESLRSYLTEHENNLWVSQITRLEVLGYHKIRLDDKLKLEELLQSAHILSITEQVIHEAIRLRQQRKRSLGDSIIAATALLHNLPLLTNNTADFTDIAGLTVIPLTSVM